MNQADLILTLLLPVGLALTLIGIALLGGRLGPVWRQRVELAAVFGLTPLFAWAIGGALVGAVVAADWPALAVHGALLALVVWAMVRLVRERAGRNRA